MKDSELPTELPNNCLKKKKGGETDTHDSLLSLLGGRKHSPGIKQLSMASNYLFSLHKRRKKTWKKISYIDSRIDCWLGFHFGLPPGLQNQQEWLLSHERATRQVTGSTQQVTRSLRVRSSFFLVFWFCKEETRLLLITGCHGRGHITHSYSTWATTAFIIWLPKMKRACRSCLWDLGN